ncbi:MAG TPA: sensor histidine kinase [Candidatus Dormibacteraeota bacterium]|nr:sensor histidine kinase [Candidatus Dormibacteraeota bacterium]
MPNVERWTQIGRWFMVSWVLFAVPTAVAILASGFQPPQEAAAFGFAVWGVLWAWIWLRAAGRNHNAELLGLVTITVILVLFTLLQPQPGGTFLVFSFIVAGACFPLRRALWIMGGLTVLQVVLAVIRLTDLATILNNIVNSVLVGGVGIGARLLWQSYRELLAAREEIARLAVSEERLRFSRDLHDLLGQSLAVLVLKSELVSKQLPADTDETTHKELRDISRVARKSLNDVREAAAGYRRPSLAMEVGNARNALQAAGIGFLVEDTLGRVAAEQDSVLAWCLREGVTNVLKHSGAKRAVLRLTRADGGAALELVDDGRGAASLDGGGVGLIGLRERVELAGGKFEVGTEPEAGVRLRVILPAGMATPNEIPVA